MITDVFTISKISDLLYGANLMLYIGFAITFYRKHRRRHNTTTQVFKTAMWMMIYLAVITIRDIMIYSIYGNNTTDISGIFIMQDFWAVPIIMFIMMELTHYSNVGWRQITTHLLPFVALTAIYYISTQLPGSLHTWVFYTYYIYVVTYIIYNHVLLLRTLKEYEQKVEDTYANTENRSLKWYRNIILIFAITVVVYAFSFVVVNSYASEVIYSLFAIILWGTLCSRLYLMKDTSLITLAKDDNKQETTANNEELQQKHLQIMQELNSLLNDPSLLGKEDLSREDVASALDMPKNEITKAIRATSGMTFSAYINDKRTEHAAHLLENTDDTVEQVLYKCGFQSRATFYRSFSTKYQCTPTDYRKEK